MKKVLVTGASGFIGQQSLRHLLAAGYEVHVVSRKIFHPVEPDCVTHQADLHDQARVQALMKDVRPTHLLHFAWHVPPLEFWTSKENIRWVESSKNILLQFAEAGGKRCVTAGTCAEYDWSGDGLCSEEKTPLRPATLYGTCKHDLQMLQSQILSQKGLSGAWGRIFHLYGPGEPRNRLVPSVICSLLEKKPVPCTRGSQQRDFMHVDDVARAFVTVLDSPWTGPLNIASGIPKTVANVTMQIAEIFGRPDLLRLGALPDRAHDPNCLIADVTLLRSLGFSPAYTLKEGLLDTIEWWRHAGRGIL